ncbi:MAG: hypothetical protein AAF552_01405 [Pseudomonadota bacterium]
MASIIRADVSRILLFWTAAALVLWQVSPWGQALEQLIGPAWLWCCLMPGAAWALLAPQRFFAAAAQLFRWSFSVLLSVVRTGLNVTLGLRPLTPVMFFQGPQTRRAASVVQAGGTGEGRR